MKETEKYKLNLIEPSDAFSPEALNENMEKVEKGLETVLAGAAAGDTALGTRIQTLEAHQIVMGRATTNPTILGFNPRAVIAYSLSVSATYPTAAIAVQGSTTPLLSFVEGGFVHSGELLNCNYIAFA